VSTRRNRIAVAVIEEDGSAVLSGIESRLLASAGIETPVAETVETEAVIDLGEIDAALTELAPKEVAAERAVATKGLKGSVTSTKSTTRGATTYAGAPRRGESWAELINGIGDLSLADADAFWYRLAVICKKVRAHGGDPARITLKQLSVIAAFEETIKRPQAGLFNSLADHGEGKEPNRPRVTIVIGNSEWRPDGE
jgi:hypothetical protein